MMFKKLTKTEKKQRFTAIIITAILLFVVVVAVAVGVGLMFLERYVKAHLNLDKKPVDIHLVDFPEWASSELRQKIITAATGRSSLKLTDDVAIRVGESVSTIAWLYDIKVRAADGVVLISARYRKPIAIISGNEQQFYIDSELVVLDYVPINKLPIVEITGVPGHLLSWRNVGAKWQRDDVAAAVELLVMLNKMDSQVVPDRPLLAEIKSIDVSNFNGRRSSSQPHIVLYANDGTEIRWGAEKGTWQRYLEARDEEKLTLLYNTYKELGTIRLKAAQKGSFVDLLRPRSISLPVDKFDL